MTRFPMPVMRQLPQTDWAYAAGLIDGEGSICIGCEVPSNRPSRRWHWEIRLGNTSRAMIDWLRQRFGGRVYLHHRKREGNRQRMYTWKQQRREMAMWFLNGIMPYLVTKRRQAELLVEFQAGFSSSTKTTTTEENQRRIRIVKEFRSLRTRKQPCNPLD